MIRPVLLCFVLLALSMASRAADVHKCATPNGVAYQDVPCSGIELPGSAVVGSAVTPSAPTRASAENAGGVAAPACGPRPRVARRLPWRQATICIGMTDDEVLNLPGWGRPAAIERTHAPREWREEWRYDSGLDGPRQLQFVNGTLILVEKPSAEAPVGPLAGLARAAETPSAAPR